MKIKKLIIVNGTMGAGKSTICEKLLTEIDHSVWLDGDWCWMMNPWDFSEENKSMVIDNITYILNNYLSNSKIENIIFSWVINKIEILDLILDKLPNDTFKLIMFTITCSESILVDRLKLRGNDEDVIRSSLSRLTDYDVMNTVKINSNHDVQENVLKMKYMILDLK